MHMEWLQVTQVRNLKSVQLSPGPRLNFLTGRNASGKTALLEAVFLLSRGKSFRTPRIQDVIQKGQDRLLVTARLNSELSGQIHTGIEKGQGEMQIRYNGSKIKTISEQTKGVPIALVTQDSHSLITAGPRERRHWLDWAMFHVEPDYLDYWKIYMKALRHRNMLLKTGVANRELYRAWEQGMVESGVYLANARSLFLKELSAEVALVSERVFQGKIIFSLSSDWPGGQDDIFADMWLADLKSGYTRQGSHNIDVRIEMEGKQVGATFSRGQIKLFICLMTIAQAKLQARRTGETPIILIDDYMAELDKAAGEYLLSSLNATEMQVFLTDTEKKALVNIDLDKTFHVERGTVAEITAKPT